MACTEGDANGVRREWRAAGADRRESVSDESARRDRFARRRTLIAAAAGFTSVLAIAGAQVAIFAAGGDDAPHGAGSVHGSTSHATAPSHGDAATASRLVGRPQTAKLADGGRAGLTIRAESATGAARLRAIPAGAPVELRLRVPGGAGTPRITAKRVGGSIAAAASGHAAHGAPAAGSAAGASAVALDRGELFLIDRHDGEVVVPSGEAAGNEVAPGRATTEHLMPGGALAWATKLTPGPSAVTADQRGRFLVATYRDRGRVEVVDLLRRGRPTAVDLGGRPAAAVVDPSGRRAWVTDESSGTVSVVDLGAARIAARFTTVPGLQALAVAGAGRALVAGADGRARLVAARSGRVLATIALPSGATAAAFAPRARAFAVAHEDGRVSVLSLRGDRRLALTATLRDPAAGAGTRTLGAAPDGRTVVALNARADSLSILDVARGREVRTVQAGDEPAQVAFLDHFAVVRNARSADVTWVDLDKPSRSNNVPVGRTPADDLYVRGGTAYASNAEDRRIYKLHVMMGRPMVMGEVPNAFAADRVVSSTGKLERIRAGRFLQRTMIAEPGKYQLAVRLPGGRHATFSMTVAAERHGAARAVPAQPKLRAVAGEDLDVRFRVAGARPRDAQVLAYARSEGAVRQLRASAAPAADGTYGARLRFADPGRYRLVLLSESAGLRPDHGAVVTVLASEGDR
jgi:YVTN family beta-propeller protein